MKTKSIMTCMQVPAGTRLKQWWAVVHEKNREEEGEWYLAKPFFKRRSLYWYGEGGGALAWQKGDVGGATCWEISRRAHQQNRSSQRQSPRSKRPVAASGRVPGHMPSKSNLLCGLELWFRSYDTNTHIFRYWTYSLTNISNKSIQNGRCIHLGDEYMIHHVFGTTCRGRKHLRLVWMWLGEHAALSLLGSTDFQKTSADFENPYSRYTL